MRDDAGKHDVRGHEWDGITELDTPLPRWWLWTFYATVIWAVIYCILYPSIPLIDEATEGVLGYSSRGELARTMEEVERSRAGIMVEIAEADLADIRADETLATFAIAGGTSAFRVHCTQCHGSGASGSTGYPNLNDDDWIWGGSLEDIYRTIAHGVRDDAMDNTRFTEMPAFGRDGFLSTSEIRDVTAHVLWLSGNVAQHGDAAAGAGIYRDHCAQCHGDAGEGMREFGAPRLSDPIWLYGSAEEGIRRQIFAASHGVMPAWRERLGEGVVKQLTLYVHSLGGGE